MMETEVENMLYGEKSWAYSNEAYLVMIQSTDFTIFQMIMKFISTEFFFLHHSDQNN